MVINKDSPLPVNYKSADGKRIGLLLSENYSGLGVIMAIYGTMSPFTLTHRLSRGSVWKSTRRTD
jgi:hypothetical protein